MRIVLDASALVAALLDEPGAEQVYAVLDNAIISTVNLAEVAATLARKGEAEKQVATIVDSLKLATSPPDDRVAVDAGLMRSITDIAGLSLGDRFCLALARRIAAPVMTSDRHWRRVAGALGVEVRLIR